MRNRRKNRNSPGKAGKRRVRLLVHRLRLGTASAVAGVGILIALFYMEVGWYEYTNEVIGLLNTKRAVNSVADGTAVYSAEQSKKDGKKFTYDKAVARADYLAGLWLTDGGVRLKDLNVSRKEFKKYKIQLEAASVTSAISNNRLLNTRIVRSTTTLFSGLYGQNYLAWIVRMCADSRVGYSQGARNFTFNDSNGSNLNVDCSSLVYFALYFNGYKDVLPDWPWDTTAEYYWMQTSGYFEQVGIINGLANYGSLQPGDIVDSLQGHTAIYAGNGEYAAAHIAENGTIDVGGTSMAGDQLQGADGVLNPGEVSVAPCNYDSRTYAVFRPVRSP